MGFTKDYLIFTIILCVFGILIGKNRILDLKNRQEKLDFIFCSVRLLQCLATLVSTSDTEIFTLLDYLDFILLLKQI